eukprot:10688804-Alexandrium_andersonii.AAC.1
MRGRSANQRGHSATHPCAGAPQSLRGRSAIREVDVGEHEVGNAEGQRPEPDGPKGDRQQAPGSARRRAPGLQAARIPIRPREQQTPSRAPAGNARALQS